MLGLIDNQRQSTQYKNGDAFLLCLAWITKSELEMAKKYPEVFSADVTEGMNSSKRPYFFTAGVDAYLKSFIAFRCLLPSQQLFVFHFCFKKAIPMLFGEDDLTVFLINCHIISLISSYLYRT